MTFLGFSDMEKLENQIYTGPFCHVNVRQYIHTYTHTQLALLVMTISFIKRSFLFPGSYGRRLPYLWVNLLLIRITRRSPTDTLPAGTYNIVQHINIPLMVQPQLFGSLAAISWCQVSKDHAIFDVISLNILSTSLTPSLQCLYYNGRLPKRLCCLLLLVYLCLFAGFETGMTYALRALLAS